LACLLESKNSENTKKQLNMLWYEW
jgi:hypothetical protein